jgi:low affinity Fe/Cu permease
MSRQQLNRIIAQFGHGISVRVANAAAQPLTQAVVILLCVAWWAVGLPTDILTASLSILAITLTQMVLNSQRAKDADDHRRDVAMHAKLDELLRAERFARKELAGIEELETEEIAALKRRLAASAREVTG